MFGLSSPQFVGSGDKRAATVPSAPKFVQSQSGGGGIRTLDTVSRIQHFQCCAFSHSATPPKHLMIWYNRDDFRKLQPTRCSISPSLRFVKLAVRVGFEPTVRLPVHRFSRPTDSATLAPHQHPFQKPFRWILRPGAAERSRAAARRTLLLRLLLSPPSDG